MRKPRCGPSRTWWGGSQLQHLRNYCRLKQLSHYVVKEGALTANCQVVYYLLNSYVMEDIMGNTDSEMTHNVKQLPMSLLEFANGFWLKTFRCLQAYSEYVLKKIFLEDLHWSIGHSMPSYGSSHQRPSLQESAYHSALLMRLKTAAHLGSSPILLQTCSTSRKIVNLIVPSVHSSTSDHRATLCWKGKTMGKLWKLLQWMMQVWNH